MPLRVARRSGATLGNAPPALAPERAIGSPTIGRTDPGARADWKPSIPLTRTDHLFSGGLGTRFRDIRPVLVQGTSIPFAAKALGITAPPDARSTATGSFDTVITGDEGPQLHEIVVEPTASAVGCQLVELALPQGVLIVLVRRGPESFMPQGSTVVAANDQLLVAAEHEHQDQLEAAFAAPTSEPAGEDDQA